MPAWHLTDKKPSVPHFAVQESLVRSSGTLVPMLRLALPVLVEQLLIMSVGLVDLWLTGNYLTESHLAAIGLMSYVMWLLPCLFGAAAIGATALTARCVGAEDYRQARLVVNQALVLGACFAVVATGLLFFGRDLFIAAVQLPAEAAPLASTYLAILVPTIPLMMIQYVGMAGLRGAGDTFSGFVAMVVVNAVNVIVSAALVVGWGPVPKLGWPGLAIGTACGYATGGLIVLGLLLAGRAGIRLGWRQLLPDLAMQRRLLRIGLPGGVDMLTVVGCHLWFVAIVNALGTVQAAAHGLGVRIESLAYLPGVAFQVAAATLAGQFLGAGDVSRARRSVLMACLVGGGLMVTAGVLFFVAAQPLVQLFLGEGTQEAAELAQFFLRLVAFCMPFLAISMILSGALRGAGDTRAPLLITLFVFVGLRIPLAYVLAWDQIPIGPVVIPGVGLGVVGAWYAMVAEIVVRSLLIGGRFLHGGWARIRV